jgi:hypothetical protein
LPDDEWSFYLGTEIVGQNGGPFSFATLALLGLGVPWGSNFRLNFFFNDFFFDEFFEDEFFEDEFFEDEFFEKTIFSTNFSTNFSKYLIIFFFQLRATHRVKNHFVCADDHGERDFLSRR